MEKSILHMGDHGDYVKDLNNILKALEYRTSNSEDEFDYRTRSAVEAFQNDYGLGVSGIVDIETWKALEKAFPNNNGKEKYQVTKEIYETPKESYQTSAEKVYQIPQEIYKVPNEINQEEVYKIPKEDYEAPKKSYQEENYQVPNDFYEEQKNNYVAPTDIYKESEDGYTAPVDIYKESEDGYTAPVDIYKEPEESSQVSEDFYEEPKNSYVAPTDIYKESKDSYIAPIDIYKETKEINQVANDFYEEPKDSYQFPNDFYEEPKDSYIAPMDIYNDPKDSYQFLKNFYERPKDSYQVPMDKYEMPKDSYQVPMDKYEAPRESYKDTKESYLGPEQGYKVPIVARNFVPFPEDEDIQSFTSATTRPTLRLGSRGHSVTELQNGLVGLGYLTTPADGVFGNLTDKAVKDFQRQNNLTPDGVVGPRTWTAIDAAILNPPTELPTIREGSTGNNVMILQEKLKHLGYLAASVTGSFGSETTEAVKAFQRANGLTADGGVVPGTWASIFAQTTAPAPPSTQNKPSLRYGDEGAYVAYLQRELQALMYYNKTITQIFDWHTLVSVKAFQDANRLTADGVVGRSTWNALDNLFPPLVNCI